MIKPHLIDQAFQWVCAQRRNYPDNADIWHLRFHWQSERARILQSLSDGNYDFAPLQSITKADGTNIHLWRSRDALVLKALTLAIAPLLPISRRCPMDGAGRWLPEALENISTPWGISTGEPRVRA